MTTLREAAQAVLDRWDSPKWEWHQGPTAALMTTLRAALNVPPPEPVGWVYINRLTGQRTFSRHLDGFVDYTTTIEAPVYAEPVANQTKTSGSPIQSEPVAFYLPQDGEDDSLFRDARTVIACTGNKLEGWIPLYTHPPHASAVNQELLEALKLALSAHGKMLLSDPPQEAWKTYGVEQKARAAIAKAEGRA